MTLETPAPAFDLFDPVSALETERLILRATTQGDAESMGRLFLGPRGDRHLGFGEDASLVENFSSAHLGVFGDTAIHSPLRGAQS